MVPVSAKKVKRRTRSPHPGVVLKPPHAASRHDYWRARFVDPDTGRTMLVRLDPLGVTNEPARRDWAIKKSKALARRKMLLESGAPRLSGTALNLAFKTYFEAHKHLRPSTLAAYQGPIDKLKAWADKHGITSADEITRVRLTEFRDSLVRERRQVPVPAGKRGQWATSTKTRSPTTVNSELRAVGTVLRYLIDRDVFGRLAFDDVRRAFKRLQVPQERIEFLKPTEIRKLLEAAIAHDAATFDFTRDEHDGLRPRGSTPKHDPIAAFVATVLLTGMRFNEAASLDWRAVDLKALDNTGAEVGEIYIGASSSKTKQGRAIDLSVSPALKALLERRRELSGGKGAVFGMSRNTIDAAAKRLRGDVKVKARSKDAEAVEGYGGPKHFSWQTLRRTCGTYLTNAPGIFAAASAYRSAQQLGHSVEVAQKHYLNVTKGIPVTAKTLEDAMQCADLIAVITKTQRLVKRERVTKARTDA